MVTITRNNISDEDPIYNPKNAPVNQARDYLGVAGRYLFDGELNNKRLEALADLREYGELTETPEYKAISGSEAEEYLKLEINQISALHEEFGGLEEELTTLNNVSDIFREVRSEINSKNLENTVSELKP